MLMGRKYFNNDIIYTKFKKHDCPNCGAQLGLIKVSKVVNSKSPEAKDFDFSNGEGFMCGDVKFIWKEFECPDCKSHYSVEELKAIEREYIIYDHQLSGVYGSKKENVSDCILYDSTKGKAGGIELDVCAKNYKDEHPESSGLCVGERKIDEKYFIFYTSGIKTKVIFKKKHVFPIGPKLLVGERDARFLKFQKLLNETKYTTRDLS